MIERILIYYNLEFNPEKKIESIHNYIDFNDFILRKGAINAHKDRLCLIAKEAAEQSERISIPKINNLRILDNLIKVYEDGSFKILERVSDIKVSNTN